MTNTTTTVEARGSARQDPRYSALCTLPDGRIITTAAAEAQDFTVLAAGSEAEPPKAPPRPLPASLAAAPPRPVDPQVAAAVVADRARVLAIRDATPPGADAEAAEAIRTGASVESFRQSLGAFTILSGMRATTGR